MRKVADFFVARMLKGRQGTLILRGGRRKESMPCSNREEKHHCRYHSGQKTNLRRAELKQTTHRRLGIAAKPWNQCL